MGLAGEIIASAVLGVAFAGLLASGFHLAAGQPPAMTLLQQSRVVGLCSIPLLIFAAPLLLLRLAGPGRALPRSARVLVTAGAVVWATMSGCIVLQLAMHLPPLFAGA
jgi:hypothetical protein